MLACARGKRGGGNHEVLPRVRNQRVGSSASVRASLGNSGEEEMQAALWLDVTQCQWNDTAPMLLIQHAVARGRVTEGAPHMHKARARSDRLTDIGEEGKQMRAVQILTAICMG